MPTKETESPAIEDSIIVRVRKLKEEHAASLDFDVKKIRNAAQAQEEANPNLVVDRSRD